MIYTVICQIAILFKICSKGLKRVQFQMLYLGREYPKGYDYFRTRLKDAFMKNKHVTEPREIKKLIKRGEFVSKEIVALYALKKYRTLKKRYYDQ